MQYSIILKNKAGDAEWYDDALLPFMLPARVLPLLTADFAEKRGLCEDCGMDTHCHPINPDGSKYCTILLQETLLDLFEASNGNSHA